MSGETSDGSGAAGAVVAAGDKSAAARDANGPTAARVATGGRFRRRALIRLLDRPVTYRVLFLCGLILGWEAFSRQAQGMLIPGSFDIFAAVGRLATQARLWDALLVSNQALFGGFALAMALGIPLGLGMGRSRRLERVADVYVSILLVTPLAGLMPLVIMALGIGLTARIVIVCVFAIVMMVVNSRAGVRSVDTSLIEMARSFGASEAQVWRRVLLPGALPAIMTGIRIGLGRAITGMVVVELLLVAVGVGGLILGFRGSLQPDMLYATVIFVVVQALIMIRLVQYAERRLTPWRSAAFGRHDLADS